MQRMKRKIDIAMILSNLQDGSTPLHLAALCGRLNVAKYLSSLGADISLKDSVS